MNSLKEEAIGKKSLKFHGWSLPLNIAWIVLADCL